MSSSSEHRDREARESGTTKRALLIGSQTYGLTGCNGDVDLIQVAGW